MIKRKGKGKGKGKVKAAKKEVAKVLTAMYVRSAKRGRGGSEVRRRWPTRSSAKLAKRERTKRSRQFEYIRVCWHWTQIRVHSEGAGAAAEAEHKSHR